MIEVSLHAPQSYWDTSVDEVDQHTGGCGPGGFGDMLVPDTVWGLSIKPACRIHDWMYYIGESQIDKDEADRVFRMNMFVIIRRCTSNKVLRRLRLRRAKTYYWFVHTFGDESFWGNRVGTAVLGTVVLS